MPGFAHAIAARAAAGSLATSLALEWSRYGIRSVCVAPGSIRTEGLDNYEPDDVAEWSAASRSGGSGSRRRSGR